MKQSKLEAALECARRGLPVFPLHGYVEPPVNATEKERIAAAKKAKTPRPEMTRFYEKATLDENQIRQWWEWWPESNIGVSTDRLLVIDLDYAKGAEASWDLLTTWCDFPKTMRTDTWSGGAHVILQLPPDTIISNDQRGKLGRGIDIRSYHGYIVAPGSEIAGRFYRFANDRPPGLAPSVLLAECSVATPKSLEPVKRVAPENDWAVETAWDYMRNRAPEAVDGQRNEIGFAVTTEPYDWGVSRETMMELLLWWNEHKCHPSLEYDELKLLARSGESNRRENIGYRNHEYNPGFDPVEVAPKVSQTVKSRLHYLPFKASVAHALDHAVDPLIEGLIDCGAMSVVYGESGCGKSFNELDKDFHIAAGLPWGGMKTRQGAVVYIAAEGGAGIHKRMKAMADHYRREDVPLFVVPCPVDLLHAEADMKPLIEMVRQIEQECGQKVLKVTIDTLSRVMAGGDENGSTDMGVLVKHFDHIRASLDVHLAVVHHTGKDKARGARGHSLLRAATDTEIEIDAGRIKVTKQKDMDGSVELRFVVKPVRVGINRNGRDVTSCYVELRQKGAAVAEQQALTNVVATFKQLLVEAIPKNYDITGKTLYDQTFTTSFAIRVAAEAGETKRMSVSASEDALEKRVERYLKEATESGHLLNPSKGQWLIVQPTSTDIQPT